MNKDLLTIREAAEFLGVSIDTLRRWDKSGKLVAFRKEGGTHRYYKKQDLEMFSNDLLKLAHAWAVSGGNIPSEFYCSNSAVFQARLFRMQDEIAASKKAEDILPLIVAIAGEIGNNSYDHNLGNWPDVPGVFFGYDINKGVIVLADRGLGLLGTLKRVRPLLASHAEALRVAFTEVVSGRAPESRGNGLKFVRRVISENPIDLFFQSGDAEVELKRNSSDFVVRKSEKDIQGCLAVIEF